MGKAAKSKKRRQKVKESSQVITRPIPNWPLLGLALIGMALTAYLTVAYWSGQAVAGCAEGSSCDVVLTSRWSKLFGLPTSIWGFLAYSSLAGIAFIKRADTYWKLAWFVSLFGVFYSLYLTTVSFIELEAACQYCLTSLALMLAIFGTVAYQKPAELSRSVWRPWVLKTTGIGVALVVALHLNYAGILGQTAQAEDPWIRGLAEHLTKTDAKFYGAYWCPACNNQKEMFGASVDRLPYIECSPGGRGNPQASVCNEAGVRNYPTWIIDGQRNIGVLSLEDLAQRSGFKGIGS